MEISSDTATKFFTNAGSGHTGRPGGCRWTLDQSSKRSSSRCARSRASSWMWCPPDARWRAGLAKRHGSIAKLMLLRLNETVVLMHDWEVHIAVTCVFAAKNRMHRSAG